MNIVLKPEAKRFLEKWKNNIDALVIDGSLDAEYVKVCGCCGPPPSPDYKVQIIKHGENDPTHAVGKRFFVEADKIVPVRIEKQLFDALEVARMSVVLFYIETAGEEEGSGTLVAKLI